MIKTKEHAVKILEAEERQRTFVLDTAQNHRNTLLLILRVSATSPIVYMYHFVF